MINVFYPYYQCTDVERQKEIDLCLKKNIENPFIDRLIVIVDDGSSLPHNSPKVTRIDLESRPTYQQWIRLTMSYDLQGVSVLCNSDIYFDDSITKLETLLNGCTRFLALSRWELLKGETSLHPNPHWSQDVWGIPCGQIVPEPLLRQLDFPLGVPRCDNKIAYLFGVYGWSVFNPCREVRSIHVHETQMRTYNKKLDARILGGVAYVHPSENERIPSKLDIDVWVASSKNISTPKLNKTMENWIREQKNTPPSSINTNNAVPIDIKLATTTEALGAIKHGQVVKNINRNFSFIRRSSSIYLQNRLEPLRVIKIENTSETESLDAIAVYFIPPVLDTWAKFIGDKPKNTEDLNFWQYPCATEKQAYENHKSVEHFGHIDCKNKTVSIYVPLPWATYIDKKEFPHKLLRCVAEAIAKYQLIAKQSGYKLQVATVCQHIHWTQIIEPTCDIGITDLYLSHKTTTCQMSLPPQDSGLRLHGWSLIAVNYEVPERSLGLERKPIGNRKILASFVGAYMPHYLDDSRLKLRDAAKDFNRNDIVVDLSDEWHFNKHVYEEQMLGKQVGIDHIAKDEQKTINYNRLISNSKFSFCPIGAGPNTLRLWESIAVGAVPVLFSENLSFFSDSSFGRDLIKNCLVWEGKIDSSIFSHLDAISVQELEKRSSELIALYEKVKSITYYSNQLTPRLKVKKLNVLYVGASVTAQKNGYRPKLNSRLESLGYEITETVLSVGGTGSEFGLCNLQHINKKQFDLAFYEYSTGDFSNGVTPIETIEDNVFKSLQLIQSHTKNVYIIHNYRAGFEGNDGDFVRDKYNRPASILRIPVLNIFEDMEEIKRTLSDVEWSDYYRDEVHTNEKGSKVIADKVLKSINLNNQCASRAFTPAPPLNPYSIVPVNGEGLKLESYSYPATDQNFDYVSLKKGQILRVVAKGTLLGIVGIVGPRSGWAKITLDGQKVIEQKHFDKYCFYTRVQPKKLGFQCNNRSVITIEILDKNINTSIAKSPHVDHEKERELMIHGFMGDKFSLLSAEILYQH